MNIIIYRARYDEPFDQGCELELLEDYRRQGSKSGLFMGYKDGKLLEILMEFKEIEIEHAQE